MERSATDEHVRNPTGFEPTYIRPRHILEETLEPAEQNAYIARDDRPPPAVIPHCPTRRFHQPLNERADGIRVGSRDGVHRQSPELAVGPWNGQGHDGGLAVGLLTERFQFDITGLMVAVRRSHRRGERSIDGVLDRGDAPEARLEVHHLGPRIYQLPLGNFVERHVRASESVNRLFRIAHQEQLTRHGRHVSSAGFTPVARRQEYQNLRLKRVRVLKLVHEKMREAPLKIRSYRLARDDEITRANQQIQKVETTFPHLERLVGIDHRTKLGV